MSVLHPDPTAIEIGQLFRRRQRQRIVKPLCGTLMRGDWDRPFHQAVSELASRRTRIARHKLVSVNTDAFTLRVYANDVESISTWRRAYDSAKVYSFPEGVTVTKLSHTPLTVRVDAGEKSLVLKQTGSKQQARWIITSESGFNARSGRCARPHYLGHGPDRSIER